MTELIRCIFCGFEVRWPVTELWPSRCPSCNRGPCAFTAGR